MDEITNLAGDLIKFQTTESKLDETRKCIDYIKNYFKDCPTLFVREHRSNNSLSLVITTKKTKHPKIFLYGHIDVVDAEDKDFVSSIRSGKLFGRGAIDMKGQVAAMMVLLKDLIRRKSDLSLGFMIVSDEEVGGLNGVRYLLSKEKYKCDLAVVPDGGENFDITLRQKGGLWLKIEAKGKSAHGSTPWLGDNALEKLIAFYTRLDHLFLKANKKNFWRVSVNLGRIQGGNAANQVPDRAEMLLDIRYPEEFTKQEIMKRIRKILSSDFKIEVVSDVFPYFGDKNNFYIKRFKKTAEKRLGRKIAYKNECGASDARFFSKQNIPIIITSPVGAGYHSRNEWVSIKSLEDFYFILKDFLISVTD